MLAHLQAESGEAARFASTLQQVIAGLPEAGDLELEDRIRLALVLAAGGRTDRAGEQVRQCIAGLDGRQLRRLTPDTLRDFLILAERLDVRMVDPQLRRLAVELLPPVMRGRQ